MDEGKGYDIKVPCHVSGFIIPDLVIRYSDTRNEMKTMQISQHIDLLRLPTMTGPEHDSKQKKT